MKEEARRAQQKQIEEMMTDELRMANLMYNKIFANPMESLGVIQEEVFEATQDWHRVNTTYSNLQMYLCGGQLNNSMLEAYAMKTEVNHLIIELIQVGAMLQKHIDSRVGWKG